MMAGSRTRVVTASAPTTMTIDAVGNPVSAPAKKATRAMTSRALPTRWPPAAMRLSLARRRRTGSSATTFHRMAEEEVLYDVAARVATVTINRPERRNSMSWGVITGLRDAVARAKADPEVRVVVITGAGDKAFCAG